MSEYIAYRADHDFMFMVDKIAARIQREIDQAALDKTAHTLEQYGYVKVVRCRDCVHGIKADLSGNWYECMKPDGNGDYARCDVEPDGFCAWGERRESAMKPSEFAELRAEGEGE